MGIIESSVLDYIKRRIEAGALSVSEAEIMDAVVPADHPEFRARPVYRYCLARLLRRRVINAVDARDGTRHFLIGKYPSVALRKSLGI